MNIRSIMLGRCFRCTKARFKRCTGGSESFCLGGKHYRNSQDRSCVRCMCYSSSFMVGCLSYMTIKNMGRRNFFSPRATCTMCRERAYGKIFGNLDSKGPASRSLADKVVSTARPGYKITYHQHPRELV
ncbi:hypothetical protein M413DRAFT_229600 [Hebeloma cylindrosporum]|uniref:Uncharacterized protein n=1 Tax=Hebeloma cylindrosporum TaxID=76867 RepID=A0A0C3CHZ4_HEBCY|nr:hypothetical protein M413DRAFT_229600 [Hebeloma cylindrosporum h7]